MINLKNITKRYSTGHGQVKALDDVSINIKKGEFVTIHGPSGCGKTTLLLTIAGMQRPTEGKVLVNQNDIYDMNVRKRAQFRAANIGFVFQMFHLVGYLNVLENVSLGQLRDSRTNRQEEARKLLEQLGMAERIFHKPDELSAGEKQRTALARALFNKPEIILADEPVGNLDPDNAEIVLEFLSKFQSTGGTIVLATHQTIAKKFIDKTIQIRSGSISEVS